MKFEAAALSLLLLLCVVTMASGAHAASSHYRVIYTFLGDTDGSNPNALTADSSGNLYGTTDQGGTADAGTIFRLTPPVRYGGAWKKTILHNFASTDGSSPTTSPLIFDQAGNLYGTTRYGGSAVYGVAFELMPPKKKGGQWTETVLYNFTGGSDGGVPNGVIFDSQGDLFGTTQLGGKYGSQGAGTIFELSRSRGVWTESTLYSFPLLKDGNRPSVLVSDAKGNLYGTASGDDVSCGPKDPVNCGWAFELEAPALRGGAWIYKQIHAFHGYDDGSFPSLGGLVFDQSGNLYGMTVGTGGTGNFPVQNAEGTIFELSPPVKEGNTWRETQLHNFVRPGGIDGSGPEGGLILDASGNLYGSTFYGAGRGCILRGCGSVFLLKPPAKGRKWKEHQLHAFVGGSDGENPGAGVILKNGILFGATSFGGNSGCGGDGCGTIFELNP